MKMAMSRTILLASTLAVPYVSHATESPMPKVIELLTNLKGKAISQGKAEEVSFTKHARWCTNSVKALEKALEVAKTELEQATDSKEANTEKSESLSERMAEAGEKQSKMEADRSSFETQRTEGQQSFMAKKADLESTISAFKEALVAVDGSDSTGTKLLQTPNGVGKTYTDHVKPYDFKSGKVQDLLQDFIRQFKQEMTDLEKGETNALNAHDLRTNNINNVVESLEKQQANHAGGKADAEEALKSAVEQMSDSSSDIDTDSKSLKDVKASCNMKQTEWKERTTVRDGEVSAIQKAIEIISKVSHLKVPGTSDEVPLAFLQIPVDAKRKVLDTLHAVKGQTKEFSSFVNRLEMILAGSPKHFEQINNAIQKMVFRLQTEQTSEDEHKNWCDQELSKTQASSDRTADKKESIESDLSGNAAQVVSLSSKHAEVEDKLALAQTSKADLQQIREEESKENKADIADGEAAGAALVSAIDVLRKEYVNSGMLSSFLQVKTRASVPTNLPEDPETWDSQYVGVAKPKGQPDGIITILGEVANTYASGLADVRAQEALDQNNFEQDMRDFDKSIAGLKTKSKLTTEKKIGVESEIMNQRKHLRTVSKTGEDLKQYSEELFSACQDGDSSYADRKTARAQEIEGLRQALTTLKNAFTE